MNEKYINAADCEKYFYEHLDDNGIIGALNAIEEMPAADVEPVKHARWIQRRNGQYYCSNCGREERFTYQRNYCPKCGAKMDLKEGESK